MKMLGSVSGPGEHFPDRQGSLRPSRWQGSLGFLIAILAVGPVAAWQDATPPATPATPATAAKSGDQPAPPAGNQDPAPASGERAGAAGAETGPGASGRNREGGRRRGGGEPEGASTTITPPTPESVEALQAASGLNDEQFAVLLKIIEEGKDRNQVMNQLEHLCGKIGPRLTGSARLEQANHWVADQFRSWGMQNVRLHEWGQFPVRFDRGPCTGRMVAPEERVFEFTARSWSAGTDGPRRGPVLREPRTPEELDAMAAELEGAWILKPIGGEDSQLLPRLRAAGIAGLITASRDELVRTGGISGIRQLEFEKLSSDVTVIVRRSDYDAINSRLADGEKVEVEFDLQHQFTKGPVPCYNTIGEIPGTRFPDEVVIISAHLDSWDGPGSQGTVDNGTGSSVTIEAARILCAIGAKPERTIRFVLWSGEEQGLLGSTAYVEQLSADERARISAVFVDDSGTNREASLTCTPAMVPMLTAAVAPMNYAFPDVPIQLIVRDQLPRRGGASDHAPFIRAGIPGFFWGKSGRAVYTYAWHTQNDKIEQAIPEYLIKNSTVSAIVAWSIANAPSLLPRDTPPADADASPSGEAAGSATPKTETTPATGTTPAAGTTPPVGSRGEAVPAAGTGGGSSGGSGNSSGSGG